VLDDFPVAVGRIPRVPQGQRSLRPDVAIPLQEELVEWVAFESCKDDGTSPATRVPAPSRIVLEIPCFPH
jgi:hypothetical protein